MMIVKTKLSTELLRQIFNFDAFDQIENFLALLSNNNFNVEGVESEHFYKIKLKYDKFEFEIRSVAMIGWSLSERINGTMQPSLIDHYDLRVIVATIVKDLISRDL